MASARTSAESDRVSHRRSGSVSRQAISPTKYRSLVDKARKETSKERNGQQHENIGPASLAGEFKDRRTRWPRKLLRSYSSSSQSDSDSERARHKHHRHRDQDDLDSSILEKHMKKLLEQELQDREPRVNERNFEKDFKTKEKPDEPNEYGVANSRIPHGRSLSVKPGQAPSVSRRLATSALPSPRASLEEPRGRQPRKSIDEELDVTAPSSPINQRSLPRFTLHPSRPSSPLSLLRKPLPSRSISRQPQSNERQTISETDFAPDAEPLHYLSKSNTQSSRSEDKQRNEKELGSADGFLSPTTAERSSRRFVTTMAPVENLRRRASIPTLESGGF